MHIQKKPFTGAGSKIKLISNQSFSKTAGLKKVMFLAHNYTICVLLSISGRRTVCVGLSQNKLQCVFVVMKKHVSQCNSVAH